MRKHSDSANNVWLAPDNPLDYEILCDYIRRLVEAEVQPRGWRASVSVKVASPPHRFGVEVTVYRAGTPLEVEVDHEDPELGLITYVRGTSHWRVGLLCQYAGQDVPHLQSQWIGDGSITLDDLRGQMQTADDPRPADPAFLRSPASDLLDGIDDARAYRKSQASPPTPAKPRMTFEDEIHF